MVYKTNEPTAAELKQRRQHNREIKAVTRADVASEHALPLASFHRLIKCVDGLTWATADGPKHRFSIQTESGVVPLSIWSSDQLTRASFDAASRAVRAYELGLIQGRSESTVTESEVDRRLVTAKALGEILGVSRASILRWARDRRIPRIKATERTLLFDPEDVIASMKGSVSP